MANQEHLDILKQGVDVWNKWRDEHKDIQPVFSHPFLIAADPSHVNLSHADLMYAYLDRADLSQALQSHLFGEMLP